MLGNVIIGLYSMTVVAAILFLAVGGLLKIMGVL